VLVPGSAEQVRTGPRAGAVDGDLILLGDADGWRDVLPGQRVRVDATLRTPLDHADLAVTGFATGPPARIGEPPFVQRVGGGVRADLREACAVLPDPERGLLPGLVVGDTSRLDPVLHEQFRLAGLTHLTAVSGTNLAILLGAVLLALRQATTRPAVLAIAGLLVVGAFVLVARPSPSVLRAAAMGLVALLGLATGRPRAAVSALAAAAVALLAYDSALSTDPGFVMSVLATGALLTIAPPWATALRDRGVPAGLAEAAAVAAACDLVTAPVVAAISGRISLVAIPANVLAEPVVALVTVLGFGAALLAPQWLGAAELLAWIAGWPCRWLVAVAEHLGTVEGASVPWPGGVVGGLALAVLLIGIVVAARRTPLRAGCACVAVVLLAVQVPVRSVATAWPPTGWLFVACDIGQGDGLVLSAGPGSAVVIDTGPEPVVMDRCLRDLDVQDVPLLVLTHFHLDHVGGITGVLRDRHVGRVLHTALPEPGLGVQILRDALAGQNIHSDVATAGQTYAVGQITLDVLGPIVTLHGTRSDPNNDSLVIRATVGATRILLPGDAEIEEQDVLEHAGLDLRADVLKVPHHGSAYSDPEFLADSHASVAIASVGVDNDYGHPAPLLLRELATLGIPLRRTDQDGDVAVRGPPGHLEVVVRGKAASAA
jgi:competence protein ComEC